MTTPEPLVYILALFVSIALPVGALGLIFAWCRRSAAREEAQKAANLERLKERLML